MFDSRVERLRELSRGAAPRIAQPKGIALPLHPHQVAAAEYASWAPRMILETGNKQVEALSLYRREGFEEIPRYEPYVDALHSICMAKRLLSEPQSQPRIERP